MEFSTISYQILNMPPYLFCAGVGFVVSVSMYILLLAKKQVDVSFCVPKLLLSIPFLLIGAKMFGIVNNIIESIHYDERITLKTFTETGIVFYGGLIGFLIAFVSLTGHKKKKYKNDILDSISVVIPLFHVFGRIGCFLSGCCYGIETKSVFAITYANYIHSTVTTTERIPVQLIEALFNVLLFSALLILFLKGYMRGRLLWIYLSSYSVVRFMFEFLRADWNREILPVSGSQITSILLIITVVIYYYSEGRYTNGKVF